MLSTVLMVRHPAVLQVGLFELRVEALELSLGHFGEQSLGGVAASTRGAVVLSAQDPTKLQTSSLVDAGNCFGYSLGFD